MHRTLTTRHPAAPGVEYRVSLHQPYGKNDETQQLEPNGDPWIVIELFIRQDNGDWSMVSSLPETAFDETVADIRELSSFLQRGREVPQAATDPIPFKDGVPQLRGRRVLTADDVD